MDTIVDFFHWVGSWQDIMERLNNLVKDGEILPAGDFNNLADIPSGPLAFDESKDDRRSKTSSSV